MRFSRDHAPDPPPRRFWLLAALFFVLLAVPLAAFNLAVDPFDFRLVPHAKLARSAIMPKNDTSLWMAGELRRIPQPVLDRVTIVFIGDSRTDSLVLSRTSLRVMQVEDDVVLNLSFGGASFGDCLRILEAEMPRLPRLPRLRAVVMGIAYDNIGARAPDRVENALRLDRQPVFYALNLTTLEWSMHLLADNAAAMKSGARAEDAPALDANRLPKLSRTKLRLDAASAPAAEDIPEHFDRELVSRWVRDSFHGADTALIQRRVRDELAPFAARLHERGIRIVFFLPPMRPEVRDALRPADVESMRQLAADLARIGPVEDYSQGGRDGIPLRFRDHTHVQAGVAAAIFAHLYLRNFFGHPAPAQPAP